MNTTTEPNQPDRINCLSCEHYYVTWDKNHPKGCRSYGFKSRQLPSLVVFQSSGLSCMHYSRKKKPKQR